MPSSPSLITVAKVTGFRDNRCIGDCVLGSSIECNCPHNRGRSKGSRTIVDDQKDVVDVKRFSIPAVSVALLLSGCAGAAQPSGTTSPHPSASRAGTAATSPPIDSLPASWRRCDNVLRGFSVGYPEDWFTTSLTPSDACAQFHPASFTIPVGAEFPLTALNAVQSPDSAATYLSGLTDPVYATTLLSESTTVLGRPATRFEIVSTGEGLHERGTRGYGYVIDRGSSAFVLSTNASPGESRYSEWKLIVDTAKDTLRCQ